MEFLIPGLILVALMVYASTRIKRTAALAFEAERIETDEYVINKPEGFLHVLNGDPRYAFEAYSRDFGKVGPRDIRMATFKMRVLPDTTLDAAVKQLKKDGVEIKSEVREVIGDHHYRLIDARTSHGGADYRKFYKLAQAGGRVFELEAALLDEAPEETVKQAEAAVESFRLK
jgi:hypothetical protein